MGEITNKLLKQNVILKEALRQVMGQVCGYPIMKDNLNEIERMHNTVFNLAQEALIKCK